MESMWDGSPRIPDGTYVRVYERRPENATRPARSYIGRVVGTDMAGSKYQVGERYGGWGRWHFADGGRWAFPREVSVIDEEEALQAGEAP